MSLDGAIPPVVLESLINKNKKLDRNLTIDRSYIEERDLKGCEEF